VASSELDPVRVDGVDKSFRLPQEEVNTLKERIVHPLRRSRYERLEALRDVSFSVAPGEFFGIVGRNGSGKSTLLKCLAGIYRVDEGDIFLRGRMAPFIELGVGFNPEMTARENVVLNAVLLGLTPRQARERYDAIIEFAELEEFTELKLKNFSSGMQVRLAFAVMVQVDADVLLIDEVLAVGDAAFQQKCHDTLNRMRGEGRTILFVTHDMGSVQRVCDRAMLLERGRIELIGDPEDVAREYNRINFLRKGEETPVGTGRTGDGAALIGDTWFENEAGERVEVLEQGARCTFRTRIEAKQPVEDPVVEVQFTDDHRQLVFAANSGLGTERAGALQPGEAVDVGVSFVLPFRPGRYYASPTVAYPGAGARVMDARRDLVSLVVTGTRATGGVVDVPHEFVMRRAGSGAAEGVGAQ
jgi:ABC-type polysaccharide/polyol phosphate transport system ATPase subunit